MACLLATLVGLSLALPAFAAGHFDGRAWWSTVSILADDANIGRDTGTAGERRAQSYVVAQLRQIGAEPAGVEGYYQPVAFTRRTIVEADSALSLVGAAGDRPLTLGEDAYFNLRSPLAPALEADTVFVGYGLDIPDRHYSDLTGLDLHGKIAVFVTGSPADIPSALSAHAQSTTERWKALRAAGAIGWISIQNPAAMDQPWSRLALNRKLPSLRLAGPEFDDIAGSELAVAFNPAHAELLFEGTGHSFAEIGPLAAERQALPHFALAVRVRARTHTEAAEVSSRNLVARLPGTDRALRNTYVVLSAHLDHLGVGEPINGDRVYNGAMDNAAGSALLLELARDLKARHVRARRSILFVWVTAEEKGLLGSRYFAAHPTVAAGSMIADVNVDQFLPIIPLTILTAYGLDESDLGARLERVAAAEGLKIQPDPKPLRNVFVRSDQYNFVLQGIPSLMVDVGAAPGTPEEKTLQEWLSTRYHAPSDDAQQPVNLPAAAKFEDVIERLTLAIANDPRAPQWHTDSFFRRYAENASRRAP